METTEAKARNTLLRYYKREKITLECRTITPLFLGNASQEAEWRAAPFKALLRYWWRVTQHNQSDDKQLLQKEGAFFGYARDNNSNKSLVQVMVPIPAIPSCQNKMPKIDNIHHPEVEKNNGNINPLLYLGGMGLLNPHGSVKHSYFPIGSEFQWLLTYPKDLASEIERTLALIRAFGAIGGRSRNGWGSFQIINPPVDNQNVIQHLTNCNVNWHDGFHKDFPNCLGKDGKGHLLWMTEPKRSWEATMAELAKVYVGIRAQTIADIPPLDPDGKDNPSERHLLGFPLTNHPANRATGWGNSGRHASPLRFIVHKASQGYIGFVLHLPHQHSTKMLFPGRLNTTEGQIQVWEKVHRKLDALMPRATYGECL